MKILIADDEETNIKVLLRFLEEFGDCTAVKNGQEALDAFKSALGQNDPYQLICLDFMMPQMNGVDALRAILAEEKRKEISEQEGVKIFITTALDSYKHTVRSLISDKRGSYLTKPLKKDEVVGELKRVGLIGEMSAEDPVGKDKKIYEKKNGIKNYKNEKVRERVDIVALGISTGGPPALNKLFSTFPENFPVPIVLVQHMPEEFTGQLAKSLNEKSLLTVKEGSTGDVLEPGTLSIAPGDFHMVLRRDKNEIKIQLNQEPLENSCRPAVDVLFRSVTEIYGPHTLAVVMTGLGHDGLKGCEKISEEGGQILVQDEESSVVWGMPGSVAKAGLADEVLPLHELSQEIVRRSFLKRSLT